MKKLIIVESPNKIKTIQKYVGDDYDVCASYGHIMGLAKGGKNGIGIDIANNFKPHYVILDDKVSAITTIMNKANLCSEIYLASDADREGEQISLNLQHILKTTGKPVFRVEFSEITKKGIEDGIAKKHDINQNLCKSQETRRILDRIVGFTVSPYLCNFYGQNLSAGRVQSVVCRMIVDREKDILKFKPKEFWNIFGHFRTNKGEKFFAKFDGKSKSKQDTDSILQTLNPKDDFFVSNIISKKKKDPAPEPLITGTLQQYCAKKLGLSPEITMRAAQSLYENGMTTYIRTDSTRSSEDAVKSVREWIQGNDLPMPKLANEYGAKEGAQDAHECIRPTNIENTPDKAFMSGDEKLVYKAIWQFFVASQMTPAVYSTLQIEISSLSDKDITFSVSGKALEELGYLQIFGASAGEKIDLPALTKGEKLDFSKDIKTEQKFTQPPPRYTDASLLKELEKKEIGRPSTLATIFATITSRNYIEKVGASYRPTDLGVKINDTLVELFSFLKYDFSSDMEKRLDQIELGKANYLDFLKEFYSIFSKELFVGYKNKYGNNIETVCQKCGNSTMMGREGKFGKFSVCVNVGCKNIVNGENKLAS